MTSDINGIRTKMSLPLRKRAAFMNEPIFETHGGAAPASR
jgi:hypothetical protein